MITNEPLTEATLLTAAAVPTAVIRHHGITMDDLRPLFDAGYSAIAASGAPIAGPAFALYTGDVSTRFDLELGFPVTDPLTGPIGEVEPSELPAGDVLVVSHLGGYDGLGPAWADSSAPPPSGDCNRGDRSTRSTSPNRRPTPIRPRCAPTCSSRCSPAAAHGFGGRA